MAYIRKPIYNFKDTGSTGVHEAANDRLLFVESQRKLFVKLNNTGLTATSTIQDAITAGNIDEFAGGGGSSFSDLYQYEFTATADQTTFACEYNPSFVYVSVAGVNLARSQFTATDGSNIVLEVGAAENEIVCVYSIGASIAAADLSLSNLKDVDLAGAQDGQVLTWNNATGKWEPKSPTSGSSSQLYQYEFEVPAGGQSTFNCTYNKDFIFISVAGINLSYSQYTADNETSVVLNEPANEDEIVKIYSVRL